MHFISARERDAGDRQRASAANLLVIIRQGAFLFREQDLSDQLIIPDIGNTAAHAKIVKGNGSFTADRNKAYARVQRETRQDRVRFIGCIAKVASEGACVADRGRGDARDRLFHQRRNQIIGERLCKGDRRADADVFVILCDLFELVNIVQEEVNRAGDVLDHQVGAAGVGDRVGAAFDLDRFL